MTVVVCDIVSLQEKQLQKLKSREVELTTKLLNNKFDDDLQQGIQMVPNRRDGKN